VLRLKQAGVRLEARPSGRLAGEPSVFGGATGAEVFMEVVRRIVSPMEALEQLGGAQSHLGQGAEAHLLDECSLPGNEPELIRGAPGRTLRELLSDSPDGDFAAAVFAATQLGIVEVLRTMGPEGDAGDEGAASVAALESDAIRESVRARLQLAEEGDYFAVLGVHRDATSYELRRAFLELRRMFDSSRLLSPEIADLAEDVRTINYVLEEAYEVLRDPARRERYKRAIEGPPEA
jgi:hypothetical protein